MILTITRPVVKGAVDVIGKLVINSSETARRIAGIRLKQAEMLCVLFQCVESFAVAEGLVR